MVKKAVAVAITATVIVAATVATVSTFGAGSVAGVAMISATVTLAAKTTEVVALQAKKGIEEGDSVLQIVKDSFESVYDNGSKIIGSTPYTKLGGIALNHCLNSTIEKMFDGKQTLEATLKSSSGKGVAYGFATLAWAQTTISIFSENPIKRAESRGYVLQ